jgi:hypothetical protein
MIGASCNTVSYVSALRSFNFEEHYCFRDEFLFRKHDVRRLVYNVKRDSFVFPISFGNGFLTAID